MKRKLIAALICLLFVFTLVGCKTTTSSNMDFSDKKSTKSTVTKDNEDMDSRYHRVNSY